MTRITIPNMTPEHHATEISLQLAMIRIEAAEQEARTWRIIAIASVIVSLIALAGRFV
jgi:type IV secretory pathway TrbF-like protein